MKKKELYQIMPIIMVGICIVGMCMVGVRIFAKKVLIGKFGIENYVTCMLADYNWGDRLERTISEEIQMTESERMTQLKAILECAPKQEQQNTSEQTEHVFDRIKNKVIEKESDLEKYCNEKLFVYPALKKVSLIYDKLVNWELVYARETGASYTLSTGFDYEAVEQQDMTDYARDLIAENEIAEAAGAEFVYVQYPYRVDEQNSQTPWGASSYENENTDAVLEMLSQEDVDFIDLRKELTKIGWEYDSGFYETDGHWTTRSGFLSAGIVAQYLNENYDFAFDSFYFDEKNYDVNSYSVNSPFVEEEVELFLPAFETNFIVRDAYREKEYDGAFLDACFDMTKAETNEYSSVLTAYSASRIRNSYLFEYENLQNCSNKKRILICSNSFSWHLIPYLALDTAYVDYVYNIIPEQMEYYVAQLNPDMVIVMDRP